jgi:ABC-type antimicrobial peptide transport system permease subunit
MSAGSRFNGALAGSFAAVAFLMAVIGVTEFAVAQGAPEIGIRMALGAGPVRVLRLVLQEGVTLAAIGAALGLGMPLAASRYLQALLYDIRTMDIRTYVAVILVIGIAAVAAAWIRAQRAASLDRTRPV